jgi:hypothetical protein
VSVLLALLLAAAPVTAPQEGAEPPDAGAVRVGLELEGPLEAVVLSEGGRPTRVDAALGPGERRTVEVPLTLWSPAPSGAEVAPRITLELRPEGAAGEARVGAVSDPRPDLWSAGLPATLTLRSRAPLEPASPRPDPVRLVLLAAAWAAVLGARRRRLLGLAAGALGAAAILAVPAPPVLEGELVVLEGDARAGRWVAVRGALDRIEVEPRLVERGVVPWVDVLGAGAPTRWRVELDPGRAPAWWLEGAGRRLYLLSELPGGPRLERGRNDGPELAEVWVREPSGGWTGHGRWPAGQPLPPERPGDPPPGWLATGLPQGIGVLLARLDAGEAGVLSPRARAGWLRLTGF